VRTPYFSHGFTIVEILVVLALLVVLAAVAAPSLSAMSDGASFDEAVEMTRSSGAVARAEAATRGEPVELVAMSSPEGGQRLVVRRFAVAPPGPAAAADASTPSSPVLLEIGEFARAIRVRAGSPSPEGAESDPELEGAGSALEAGTSSIEVVLGVYWPSGSSRVSEAWFIEGPGDRLVSGAINPWNGAIDLSPIARVAPGVDTGDDADSLRDASLRKPSDAASTTRRPPAEAPTNPQPTKAQPPKPTSPTNTPTPGAPEGAEEPDDDGLSPPKSKQDENEEEEEP